MLNEFIIFALKNNFLLKKKLINKENSYSYNSQWISRVIYETGTSLVIST